MQTPTALNDMRATFIVWINEIFFQVLKFPTNTQISLGDSVCWKFTHEMRVSFKREFYLRRPDMLIYFVFFFSFSLFWMTLFALVG